MVLESSGALQQKRGPLGCTVSWGLRVLIPSDFDHYARHLLLDVYPLSPIEYAEASLERRASYSYVNEIIEGAQDLARSLLTRLRQRVPHTWKGRVQRAGKAGLFPPELSTALVELRHLRNSVVHENREANADLIVYPHLSTIIVVSFALFEVWYAAVASSKLREDECVVDKEYLLQCVTGSTDERALQAHARLVHPATSVPRIAVPAASIRELVNR